MRKAVVGVAAMTMFMLTSGCGQDSQEPPPALSVMAAVTTGSTVVADAIVVPGHHAKLSLPTGGIVAEILVDEGDQVEEGHVLLRLDADEQSASLEQAEAALAEAKAGFSRLEAAQAKKRQDEDEARPVDAANTRTRVRDAREQLKHVSGANQAGGVVLSPEGAALEAERAVELAEAREGLTEAREALLDAMGVSETSAIPETPESAANLAARQKALADARIKLLDARGALADAEDLNEVLQDGQDRVDTARKNLANATRDLVVATLAREDKVDAAQERFDDEEQQHRNVYKKWLGVVMTDEETGKDPDTLFEAWEVDLESVFDARNLVYSGGVAPDVPSTRWNELTIYAWLRFHPNFASISVTCEETDVLTPLEICIEREMRNAWDEFEEARINLETVLRDTETAIAKADNAVVKFEEELEDTEEDLEELRAERATIDIALAKAELAAAEAALEDLEEFADPVDVAVAEAELAEAQAAFDDLLDWPDPLEVALAQEELTRETIELRRLGRGRDPLDVELDSAELEAASAEVASAEAGVALARAAIGDRELRAPFAGTVVSIDAEVGEQVSPQAVVLRLADVSTWRIETDDLDELSVVNLQEGDKVKVTFDSLPNVEIPGTVVRISQFGEKKQGAITYTAEIDLDQQDSRLRWNMTASIKKSG